MEILVSVLRISKPRRAQSAPDSDRRRLEKMFDEHHQAVWRLLRRRGLAPEAAADATQQCFLVAAERMRDIRDGSERAFLLGTALRLASAAIRNGRRWQLEDDMDACEPLANGRVDDRAEQRHTVELMDRLLARMDPTLVEVFVLFEVEGLSTPEIARLLGVPLGTVASRLRRARESFRAVTSRLERILRRETGSDGT